MSALRWVLVLSIILAACGSDADPPRVRAASARSGPHLYHGLEPVTTTTSVPPTTSTTEAEVKPVQPAPATVPVSAAQVAALVREVFGQEGAVVAEQALRVVDCETGGTWDPRSYNGKYGASGLFQIVPRYHRWRAEALGYTWEQVATGVRPNIEVAFMIWSESRSWKAWDCRP